MAGPAEEPPGSPSRFSDLYVAMTDVGLVEFAAASRVQKQSTAIGYLKAQHHTLSWEGTAGGQREEREILIYPGLQRPTMGLSDLIASQCQAYSRCPIKVCEINEYTDERYLYHFSPPLQPATDELLAHCPDGETEV